MDSLFKCRTPALLKIQRCSGGFEVIVNPDGNCYGVSWLVPVVASAARCPADLEYLLGQISAGEAGGAFRAIGSTRKVTRQGAFVVAAGAYAVASWCCRYVCSSCRVALGRCLAGLFFLRW